MVSVENDLKSSYDMLRALSLARDELTKEYLTGRYSVWEINTGSFGESSQEAKYIESGKVRRISTRELLSSANSRE